MEFFGFAPSKRSLCEEGTRERIFWAKCLGKACTREAYLSDHTLACVSGCSSKAAFCKLPSLSGEDAAILCSFFLFTGLFTQSHGSIISHGYQMLVAPLALAYCQMGGSFSLSI